MSEPAESDVLGEEIGVVSGTTKISAFTFNVPDLQKVMHGQYVIAKDSQTGTLVLAQVVDILASGTYGQAKCEVLGEIKDSKLLTPKRPITTGSGVYMPKSELLEKIISSGLPERRILIGRVLTHPDFVPVYFNPDDLARHMVVIAATGGGKSYTLGVIIEEILEFVKRESGDYAVVIFDIHNEYGGLLLPNDDPDQVNGLKQYGLEPKGYADQILIFDWTYNPPRLSDVFTPDRLMFLYGMKEERYVLYLRDLMKGKEKASLKELERLVMASDYHMSTKKALLHRIRAAMHSGLFSHDEAIDLRRVIKPGYATIFRLSETPMGDQGVRFFVADVLLNLYKLYRERKIKFKTILVIDEAHIFAPRKGKGPVKEIIERIIREGRKYGLWVVLATQGSRDLSDVILINCGTLLALRMQREDVSELTRIFGVPKGVAEALTLVKPGKGYLKAPSLAIPVMVAVRPKRSLDLKGRPDIIARAEKAVKEVAERTRRLLGLAREREEVAPPTEISPREVTPPPRPPEPAEARLQKPQAKPATKLPEEKPFAVDLRERRELSRPKPAKRPRIDMWSKSVQSLAETMDNLGPAAIEVMKMLYKYGDLPMHHVLSVADDLVIEALKALGLVREDAGILRLSVHEYMRRKIGRRVSYDEGKKALGEALKLLGE